MTNHANPGSPVLSSASTATSPAIGVTWRIDRPVPGQQHIPGISGIDTRALTRHIRSVGDTRAVLVQDAAELSDKELVAQSQGRAYPRRATMSSSEVAFDEVSTDRTGRWTAHCRARLWRQTEHYPLAPGHAARA